MRYKGQIYVYIIHTYNDREHGSRCGSKEEEQEEEEEERMTNFEDEDQMATTLCVPPMAWNG